MSTINRNRESISRRRKSGLSRGHTPHLWASKTHIRGPHGTRTHNPRIKRGGHRVRGSLPTADSRRGQSRSCDEIWCSCRQRCRQAVSSGNVWSSWHLSQLCRLGSARPTPHQRDNLPTFHSALPPSGRCRPPGGRPGRRRRSAAYELCARYLWGRCSTGRVRRQPLTRWWPGWRRLDLILCIG